MIRGLQLLWWWVALSSPALAAADASWFLDGGRLELRLDRHLIERFGLNVRGDPVDEETLVVTLAVGGQGSIEFQAPQGRFQHLIGGTVPIEAVPIEPADLGKAAAGLRLKPAPGHPPAFELVDSEGRAWFRLDYGHFDLQGDALDVRVMDLRLGPALASKLDKPDLSGHYLGSATLSSNVRAPDGYQGVKGACTSPQWPTAMGADADIAMTGLDAISEISAGASPGRVIIAPSAYFTNVGTADVPWFAMFANPSRDPAFCFDDGNGACEPYGTDQGGKLVFNFYRFVDGHLEQLGRSGVKHAFNSVNFNCPCNSGRIVWQGCEDLYSVSTNADRDFLGPRSELTAHLGLWEHRGSIFDTNSDDLCDQIENGSFFGGQRCETSPSGPLERRLHVAAADLDTAGARYFIETWYIVRDDVDIFNSMGHREVDPTLSTAWTFPFVQDFVQGPVVDQLPGLAATDAGLVEDDVDTGEGRFRVTTAVTEFAGHWRYEITLMNFDFDRAIRGFEIDLPGCASATEIGFLDGDDDPGNDWGGSAFSSQLRWQAPPGAALTWGAQVAFTVRSDHPPVATQGQVRVDQAGSPTTFAFDTLAGVRDLYCSSFE